VPEGEEEVPDAGAIEVEEDLYEAPRDQPEPAQASLHPDDLGNFFKLSQFLEIVLAHFITDGDIDRAEVLIRAYCKELLHVSSPDTVLLVLDYSRSLFSCMVPVS
jgi:hypothetical protein